MILTRNYSTIDSTNLEAHRLFASGERGPLWVLADEQTAGKGRLDRSWASARGNCYSTLILPLPTNRHAGEGRDLLDREIPAFAGMTDVDVGLAPVPQISFVVALAVAHTIQQLSGVEPHVKWPNDCLVNGAKISGILCEVISVQPLTIAIGCGINVTHAPTGLAYPAVCLAQLGSSTTRDDVFFRYSENLLHWLSVWSSGNNFAAIREAWVNLAIGIGETVTMSVGSQQLTGRFETITEQGALMLKPPHGPPHILHAGDLHIPSLAALRNGTT